MSALKIGLANAYFYPLDKKQWANHTPYPPLGTIWAVAHMRELGYDIALFDTNLRSEVSELDGFLEKEQPDFFIIYDDGFNYLTKMCLTTMREKAFDMISMARKKGVQVIVNSSDSTDHYEQYLAAGAHAVILGEGEKTLEELIKQRGELLSEVNGIAFLKDGKPVKTAKRPVLRDLDSLPQPAWDLVDVAAYRTIWKHSKYPFTLNIATTRGCPFKCNWCAKPIYGNRYNSRSPQRVVEEIKHLSQAYGVTHFWMCDDIFGLKPGWVKEFNQLLKKENLSIRYKIQSRVDLLLEDNTIQELAESGLDEVWLGAESGSQKILDAMDKGIHVQQIEQATAALKKFGVKVCFFIQFGYLGETKEDILQTIAMIKRLKPYDIGVSVSYPLPETKFYDKVAEQFQGKTNWVDSDELAMMFQGTFNSSYYKDLHRYVHRVFRVSQAMSTLSFGRLLKLPYQLLLLVYFRTRMAFKVNQ